MENTYGLEVSVDEQTITLFRAGAAVAVYPVSTAAKGVGFREGSLRTPTGRFRVCAKHGGDAPVHTIFRDRAPVGLWLPGDAPADDLVLTRVLELEGLDPANANTRSRHIYIHGTNREDLIGRPASHGCIRLANADIIGLFRQTPEHAPLVIHPPSRRRGRLFFIDCDSTLSAIEGIDELARARGAGVFDEVVALTHAAMEGRVPLDEVFGRRVDLIRPDAASMGRVADLYVERIMPGMRDLIPALKERGWTPVVLSGGFAPLIAPLAAALGIEHVEAVPLHTRPDGGYAGYGADYPTTRSGGKPAIIAEWRDALLPERVVMMGDGVSDMEAGPMVDLFIGYGGVVARDRVKAGADVWLERDFSIDRLLDAIE